MPPIGIASGNSVKWSNGILFLKETTAIQTHQERQEFITIHIHLLFQLEQRCRCTCIYVSTEKNSSQRIEYEISFPKLYSLNLSLYTCVQWYYMTFDLFWPCVLKLNLYRTFFNFKKHSRLRLARSNSKVENWHPKIYFLQKKQQKIKDQPSLTCTPHHTPLNP